MKYRISALRSAAERAAIPATCQIHNLLHEPQGGGKTMGCPTCVAIERQRTRKARAHHRKWGPLNYGRKPKAVPRQTQANDCRGDISLEAK